jgi:hypothetical protein
VSEQSSHLSTDEVALVLRLVRDADAVVVGGQSMAIWARHYSDYNADIAEIYTMSSEDVDFYGSRKAAENFAAQLGNAKILIPDLDDHGPLRSGCRIDWEPGNSRRFSSFHTWC